MAGRSSPRNGIFTVGHSTRTLDEFIRMLKAHGVNQLVDARTIPRSRRNPQFNRQALGPCLRRRRINYRHMKILGGLRHAGPDSINRAWRNASFRGFADYMQTPEFEAALQKLIRLSSKKSVAVMCAEAVPWRCHRSLIADALAARKIRVWDIFSPTHAKPHRMTPWARIRAEKVTYPA